MSHDAQTGSDLETCRAKKADSSMNTLAADPRHSFDTHSRTECGPRRVWASNTFLIAAISISVLTWAYVSASRQETLRHDAEIASVSAVNYAFVEAMSQLEGTTGVMTVDRIGKITGWSKSCENMLGWTPSEILGKTVETLMPEATRETHRKAFQTAVENGEQKVLFLKCEILDKAGDLRRVHLVIRPYRDKENQLQYMAIIDRVADVSTITVPPME